VSRARAMWSAARLYTRRAAVPMPAERPDLPPGRAIEIPGRGVTWIREAPGPRGAPVLLLLHGLGATGAINWFAVFESLRDAYRVIAIDHRGHGRGLRPRGRFRLADCADDAAALAAQLGIERVIAVGYSMGGPIAQLLWYRHRSRVEGLVLCATARNFRGNADATLGDRLLPAMLPGLALGTRMVPIAVRRRMLRDLLSRRIRSPETLEWVLAETGGHDFGALFEAWASTSRFSSAAWIGSVDVPTAVVVTERDQLVSPDAQRKLAASIPGATVHGVDGDHVACAYRPREFVAALREACDSVATRARLRASA
jgi:pimeloyl-ACP methyl ester carboxylesterase